MVFIKWKVSELQLPVNASMALRDQVPAIGHLDILWRVESVLPHLVVVAVFEDVKLIHLFTVGNNGIPPFRYFRLLRAGQSARLKLSDVEPLRLVHEVVDIGLPGGLIVLELLPEVLGFFHVGDVQLDLLVLEVV